MGIVNVSYMASATLPPMKPFMQLAETLGTLAAQLSDSKPVSMELRTWGGRDVNITTKQARNLLEACTLKGMLKHMGLGLGASETCFSCMPFLTRPRLLLPLCLPYPHIPRPTQPLSLSPPKVPDMISAPVMAKEAKLLSTIMDEAPEAAGSPYWNLVSLRCKRADGTSTKLTGAVFGSTPMLVQVDEFKDLFAFKPEGSYILSFRNLDVPGAISEVLTVLHNASINVANVTVARSSAGVSAGQPAQALCFMALDDDVPTSALNTLKKLPGLEMVSKIALK